MSHYNNTLMPGKPTVNDIGSFEKAVMTNSKESIEKHLSHMKIDQDKLSYALFLSIQNFKLEERTQQCVLILLRHKANPNYQFNKQTPLTLACRKGQQLLVKTLIESGAKADACNKNGQYPLTVVLQDKRQNYDVAQILLNSMNSVNNIEIGGKHPIVITVEKQFLRIFQMLIQKNANLVYDSQNILHIIAKKKFKKSEKKKKFIKELAGRLFLMQEDSNHKLPTDYQQNQDIKAFILQNFKPKILKHDSSKQQFSNKSIVKQKQSKQSKNKDPQQNNKDVKKKVSLNKELDISFSQVDQEQYQEQKADALYQNKKLKQVAEIPQEQQNKNIKQKRQKISSQKQSNIVSPHFPHKKTIQKIKQTQNSQLSRNQKSVQKMQLSQAINERQRQQEKQKIKKKLNNSVNHTQSKKKPNQTQITQQHINTGTKKKKSKNNQQIISKTLLKRKNSSFEQESMKLDKNKSTLIKKGTNKKQVIEINQKLQKERIMQQQQRQKIVQARRYKLFKQFQQLGLHIQEQKNQKQSQTDSQQSQGSIVNLNQQIYQLVTRITIENEKKIATVEEILKFLDSKIRNQIQMYRQNARLQLYVYGSQSTGLAIQDSDVDLLVVSDVEYNDLMKLLQQRRSLECNQIIQAKFITMATMPVIKLKMSSKFNHINVDLTFQTRNHTGLKCSQTIKAFMQAEPLLRPLVLVIKVLVKIYGINDPYKGGISSYAITLMVIALLQFTQVHKKKPQNVGELLLNFFYFYGQQIDYVSQAIIIHALGLFGEQPLYCIYRLPYFTDLNPKLIIYDPLNPVNNVGRTTYRISAIKKLFSVCYLRLKESQRCHLKDLFDGSFYELLN